MKRNVQNKKIYFNLSDVWFFLTIAIFSKDKYTPIYWGYILAIGDGLNHAVFTPNEIINGLKKLLATGLIEINDNRIRLTDFGMKLKNKCVLSIDKCQEIMNGLTYGDLMIKSNVNELSSLFTPNILKKEIQKYVDKYSE